MDPITHITSGALAGQAFRDRFPGRTGLGFCILAGWIPDMDNLIALTGDPEIYLLHHRGVTHSFLGGLALAALLVGAFRLFKKSFPLLRGFCVAYGCIALHIVLDLVTSYGTQIIAPLSDARFAISSVLKGKRALNLLWSSTSAQMHRPHVEQIYCRCVLRHFSGSSMGVTLGSSL